MASPTQPDPARFHELQRFARGWFWFCLAVELPFAAIIAYRSFQQLVLRHRWGNQPMTDGGLVLFDLAIAAVLLGVVWLMRCGRLEVRVTRDLLDVNFFPLRRKRIALANVVSAVPRQFSPLGEFGGWGLRLSLQGNGWGYFMRGNRGVQLVLASGKRMLVGSQRPGELAAAIRGANPNVAPQRPAFTEVEL